MPVSSPLDCSWEDLRKALRAIWVQTTAASNWMMTELYARDVRRGSEEKTPPMTRVYLYPEARARFSGLPSQTVASLVNSVQRKYLAVRYPVAWTAAASLPTHRYPTPFPVPSQGWHAQLKRTRPSSGCGSETPGIGCGLSGAQFRANGVCATDKRSAITGGNACRPDRSRKAVKRPGYAGFCPDRPGSDYLMYWSFRGLYAENDSRMAVPKTIN